MRAPVVQFSTVLKEPEHAIFKDEVQRVIGRVVSLNTHPLVHVEAGQSVTPAAGPGTTLVSSKTPLDLGDAGIDSLRLTAYAKNSSGGTYTLQLFDTTNQQPLCTVVVTGTSAAMYTGAWTGTTPKGGDQQVELRVLGNPADTATLYRVDLQTQTVNAKP